MTARRILTITSHKKRDTMIHDDTTGTPQRPSSFLPAQTNIMPFIATARDIDPTGTEDYSRQSQNVYMKGFSDKFIINTNDASPWEFRYVAFRYKGPFILQGAAPGTYFYNQNSSGGYNRVAGVYQDSSVLNLITEMFKGTRGTDWLNYQQATLDTARITPVLDKKFGIRSGNEHGTFLRKSMWVPYNANLTYAGDEVGDKVASQALSTNGNRGKGDLYIVIFANVAGSFNQDSRANILFDSTLYWSEK